MSGFMLCTNRSAVPFHLKDIDKNVYSIEEIGYYLYNYVYLIDESFFDEDLIRYIEEDLKLTFIADGIRQVRSHRAGLSELISYVVNAASYYSAEELVQLQKELALLEQKSSTERLKEKGDILLNHKKYRRAFQCYRTILQKRWDAALGNRFYGNIYNNLGIVCANMFKYKDAAECFRESYKLTSNLGILKHLIMNDYLVGDKETLEQDVSRFHVSDKMLAECRQRLEEARSEAEVAAEEIGPETVAQILNAYRQDS